jgi:hypothetical protein
MYDLFMESLEIAAQKQGPTLMHILPQLLNLQFFGFGTVSNDF